MAVILPSTYTDGTATIALNGVTVTGQGTMFLNTVLPGDFFGTHKGFPTRIATVNSNTSLTLAYNYGGPAQTAERYEIMYQGDNARMAETTRQMLEALRGGNLTSMAGLAGGADKLPYFTGLGTMDQTDLTPYVRGTVMNSANRAALLASAGGIGVSENVMAMSTVIADCNVADTNGFYSAPAGSANNPNSTDGFWITVNRWGGSNTLTQTAQSVNLTPRTWSRIRSNNTWNAWFERSTGPLVGTVSTSGGIPNGAIIERGSNANGEYTKFADGTQIAFKLGEVDADFAAGAAAQGTWTTPVTFIGTPLCMINHRPIGSAPIVLAAANHFGSCIAVNSSNTALYAILNRNTATMRIRADLTAIGRWF